MVRILPSILLNSLAVQKPASGKYALKIFLGHPEEVHIRICESNKWGCQEHSSPFATLTLNNVVTPSGRYLKNNATAPETVR
jgi:hypothetical protein